MTGLTWTVDPQMVEPDIEALYNMSVVELRVLSQTLQVQYIMTPDDDLERLLHQLTDIIKQKTMLN